MEKVKSKAKARVKAREPAMARDQWEYPKSKGE